MWWVLKIEQDYIQFPFWYVIKSTERGLFVNRPVRIIPSKSQNRARIYSNSFLVHDQINWTSDLISLSYQPYIILYIIIISLD